MNIDFPVYFAPDTGAATAEAPKGDTDSAADTAEGDASDDTSTNESGDSAPATQDAAEQTWDLNELQKQGDLNDSMQRIGGNLGRDDGDAGTEGATDETEEEGEAASTNESEPETEEASTEESADETSEAEGDQPDAEEAEEGEEGEAGEEGEDEEDLQAEGETLPDEVQETVSEHFPGRVIETTEDLNEAMSEVRQTVEIFDVIDRAVEEDSDLEQYFELRFQEDVSQLEAKVRAFGDLEDAPSKEENPEAYADWIAEYKQAKQQAEQDDHAEEQISEAEQRLQQETEASFKRLKQERDMSDDEFDRFTEEVNKLVFGDQRGRVPSDQAERLYFALNKDQVLDEVREEAYEEGVQDAKNGEIEEDLNTNQKGDGLPNPGGSAEPEEPKSDFEKRLDNLGGQFEGRGADPDDFSW